MRNTTGVGIPCKNEPVSPKDYVGDSTIRRFRKRRTNGRLNGGIPVVISNDERDGTLCRTRHHEPEELSVDLGLVGPTPLVIGFCRVPLPLSPGRGL